MNNTEFHDLISLKINVLKILDIKYFQMQFWAKKRAFLPNQPRYTLRFASVHARFSYLIYIAYLVFEVKTIKY